VTEVVPVGALGTAVRVLDDGGVVGVPTDTVYGLAARLDRPAAVDAVFALKRRPPGLALPVLLGAPAQLDQVVAAWPSCAARLAGRFWPGGLTLVVPAPAVVGRAVGGDGATVGVRVPDDEMVRQLCLRCGPLAVTSANRHGSPPCTRPCDVVGELAGELSLVVDGGTRNGAPSTVVDCALEPPACRREGAIPWEDIEAALA
jgi:L-threonylcarbamoyladenylate synthase